ncbi:hypothetical protein HYDPIDRAFT_33025 [Hydnomerulius pinastri MD-312]|uniref:Uncharacterized protein n=1 Tax=Hydnomerulius pinastri MD-312 TaxID=994086 RepID=A0A0C9V2U6_9AGAM|nr:hypothetical protein HYDPIDRAFT_33025 [Hydnomerulius pinastri MD-312]
MVVDRPELLTARPSNPSHDPTCKPSRGLETDLPALDGVLQPTIQGPTNEWASGEDVTSRSYLPRPSPSFTFTLAPFANASTTTYAPTQTILYPPSHRQLPHLESTVDRVHDVYGGVKVAEDRGG